MEKHLKCASLAPDMPGVLLGVTSNPLIVQSHFFDYNRSFGSPKFIKGDRNMIWHIRSDVDRRSGEDRRKEMYSREDNFRYFSKKTVERRSWKERRSNVERRANWLRVNRWCSCLWEM